MKRCLYCNSTENLKLDEFDAWMCKVCEKNINQKVEDIKSELESSTDM